MGKERYRDLEGFVKREFYRVGRDFWCLGND